MKLLYLSLLICATVPVIAAEDTIQTIIEEGRKTVGTNAVLDGLVTVKMSGTVEPANPTLPSAKVLLIARKPCSQRLEVHINNMVETTLLQGNSGCIIQAEPDDADKRSRLRMMTIEEVRRMAFNTRQLFNYYREDSANGESVRYEGTEQRWGVQCHKLVYSYPNGVSTKRYFSVDEKKLISTITDKGVESVEIGTQTVNEIKFPKQIEYYQAGKLLHTMILETVEVNKPLKVGVFTIPAAKKTQ